MKRLFERISSKAQDPSQAPVLIVALGDSLTQGVMEHRRLDSSSVYHRMVQERLDQHFPATTFSTINAGVSGNNVAGCLERLERDVIRHQPDLVFVAFGSNDSIRGSEGLVGFENGLKAIIGRIKNETEADVLLLTPPFIANHKGGNIHPDHLEIADEIIRFQTSGALAEYSHAIHTVGLRQHIMIADIFAEWERLAADGLDTDIWLVNGLNHPGSECHQLAANAVFHALLTSRPPMPSHERSP